MCWETGGFRDFCHTDSGGRICLHPGGTACQAKGCGLDPIDISERSRGTGGHRGAFEPPAGFRGVSLRCKPRGHPSPWFLCCCSLGSPGAGGIPVPL